jgi:hypothetical protein
MRYLLRVDDLSPINDRSGMTPIFQNMKPIVCHNCDDSGLYSRKLQERINWLSTCCAAFSVYSGLICNGYLVYNAIIIDIFDEVDSIMFKLRWVS